MLNSNYIFKFDLTLTGTGNPWWAELRHWHPHAHSHCIQPLWSTTLSSPPHFICIHWGWLNHHHYWSQHAGLAHYLQWHGTQLRGSHWYLSYHIAGNTSRSASGRGCEWSWNGDRSWLLSHELTGKCYQSNDIAGITSSYASQMNARLTSSCALTTCSWTEIT